MSHMILQIIVMTLVTYAVRIIPLTLIRKPIKSRFIRSFLYYVPYVSLAVMTFPTMIYATNSIWSGLLAFVTGVMLTWYNASLPKTAVACCMVVLISEFILI
ncbi:MAG: AzlD domain-containing protein [Solobacterium sp.]|nr:AzlD domain-containing protein [Solobacterium sp.]MBR3203187.1 AzlD domain-containing protein [Solobacterium sp.]